MKKIVSILLAAAMITGVCACSKTERTKPSSDRQTGETTTEEETASAPETELTEDTSAPSEETSPDTSEDTSGPDLTADPLETAPSDPETSAEGSQVRPLSAHPVNVSFVGLSNDEIIESIRNITMIDSDSIDRSYGDRFSIEYFEPHEFSYNWDLETLNIPEGISMVEIPGRIQEDESIELTQSTYVDVTLRFDSADRAVYVYNVIVDMLANRDPDNPRNPTTDDREGNSWMTVFLTSHVQLICHDVSEDGSPVYYELIYHMPVIPWS